MEMISPGGVDHQAVRRIGAGNRCVAPQSPQGEALQRLAVSDGIGVQNHQLTDKGLCLRRRHPYPHARPQRQEVGRQHHAPTAFAAAASRVRRSRSVGQVGR